MNPADSGASVDQGTHRPGFRLPILYREAIFVTFVVLVTAAVTGRASYEFARLSLTSQIQDQLNTVAACAIAWAAGLPVEAIQQGATSLTGVEHRLEFIRSWGGADWFNDSIATAPERAIAAINSFHEPLVLLAGGRDKDLPWDDFARKVLDRVRAVVCFGEAADLIASALQSALKPGERMVPLQKCAVLEEAVQAAANLIEDGDVVLLSPGGTSFDDCVDFAERGEMFRKWVRELS